MSRSKRKTPIFGMTHAKSEKRDKQEWHSRMRAKVRSAVAVAAPKQLDGYMAPVGNDVGNTCSMAKDGKHFFSRGRQIAVATRIARKGKTANERQSLKTRLLRKWAGK